MMVEKSEAKNMVPLERDRAERDHLQDEKMKIGH